MKMPDSVVVLCCASGVMLSSSSTFLFDLPLISAVTVQLHSALKHACDLLIRVVDTDPADKTNRENDHIHRTTENSHGLFVADLI